ALHCIVLAIDNPLGSLASRTSFLEPTPATSIVAARLKCPRRKVRMFLSDKGASMLASQNKRVEEHEAKVEDNYGNEDAQRLKIMLESFIKQIV
ncbi:MAG: hypothetical protein AAAB35_13975, partial [Phyllobacterium sp.]